MRATKNDDLQLLEAKGQGFVRIGLLAVDKGKQGLEHTKHTLPQIQSLLQSMTDAVGKTISYSDWNVKAEVAQPCISKKPSPASTTMDDHKSPVWIAKDHGYVPGRHIKQKDTEVVWTINAISEAGMFTLSQAMNYNDDKSTEDVALKEILNSWVQVKCCHIPCNTRL